MSTAEHPLMERDAFFHVREKSDRIMSIVLFAYFAFGLFLATFYGTWVIAIGVGTLSLAAYFLSEGFAPRQNALSICTECNTCNLFSIVYLPDAWLV